MERPVLRLDGFDADISRRMITTVSCADSDDITKVEDAGSVREVDGQRVQVMHNGLLVEEGGYFGDWTTEIIRALRGHHEPQEELVFDRILQRLKSDTESATMIEFGSFWTYYGLWFCHALPAARVVGLEPDPAYLEIGRRNAELNGLTDRATFVAGGIGDQPGEPLEFLAQSDDTTYTIAQHDLSSLMSETGLDHVDLVLADVQGAETVLLERARGDLAAGKVRFLIVSTHHSSFSGDPLTHQKALRLLEEVGGHVIAEHSITESFSGDGLIAVSFDPRDKDFVVELSRARSKDSLFGELEYELGTANTNKAAADEAATNAVRHAQHVENQLTAMTADRDRLAGVLDQTTAERDAAAEQLAAVTDTRLWRWSRGPRRLYQRVRQGG